ncbi:type II toxin-antitoxin system RelE/ParE family toxin [Sphingomonas floccifaciens]|uniref:Type II toxin-antitoxin system RelE/ParE family toxin n=1 Tax=Sphingomonas floccifaciens TaxID=1844115 RepID=A0ABW4NB19_9SPHN
MYKVVWPDAAVDDLDAIGDYIRTFDPSAARSIRLRLIQLGESLAHFPNRGRPSIRGARELASVPPYVLRYRVYGEFVVILSIRHGRRRPFAD